MSKRIERWQAQTLRAGLYPSLNYLTRLFERMERAGFTRNDKLYQLVRQARDAVFDLHTEVHYLACGGGVGRDCHPETPECG